MATNKIQINIYIYFPKIYKKMNFEFDINSLLPHEITKFTSDLRIVHPGDLRTDDPSYYQLNRYRSKFYSNLFSFILFYSIYF